ncbi:DUF6734 family protein [Pedobacter hartonius]|uniref:DUF6734 domain-containing protein n=1 Tax=Pedobacter hartonius TaxID=425514 RepID=A0A1H4H5L0_9SPHI|nr:DUF6734 family protein [Pedobacter hartonius]SEB17123.1 hypothetical protein SAMN05443550_113145 [Pedobacter hartonius]
MRIVQSFWSSNRNLLENRFGWVSPQYHLMAWTLSSLKLREHYEDLHLCTDSNGYAILIDQLNLPYSSAEICYDNIEFDKNQWGISKILTYAAQTKPFIHVDADVFIWDKFSEELEQAGLIAQNIERGTDYSDSMFNELRSKLAYIPDIFQKELDTNKVSSYNAGIIGGSDISFFRQYADEALEMVSRNKHLAPDETTYLNFNILFEQVLFSLLSKHQNKKVTCYFKETFDDNGYLISLFSDFSRIALGQKYFHLIGGSKRNKAVCDLMSAILLNEYPEYYHKIIRLFPDKHKYFYSKIFGSDAAVSNKTERKADYPWGEISFPRTARAFPSVRNTIPADLEVDYRTLVENQDSVSANEIFEYERNLSELFGSWCNINAASLTVIETSACNYFAFFAQDKNHQLRAVLQKNPHLTVIEDSFDWLPETKSSINQDIGFAPFEELNGLAIIPRLFLKGYEEILIDGLDHNIFMLLTEPLSFGALLKALEPCFSTAEIYDEYAAVYELMLKKLKYLFHSKCLFIPGSFTATN